MPHAPQCQEDSCSRRVGCGSGSDPDGAVGVERSADDVGCFGLVWYLLACPSNAAGQGMRLPAEEKRLRSEITCCLNLAERFWTIGPDMMMN